MKSIWIIAVLAMTILLLMNIGWVTDMIVGWDDNAKREYAHQLELNQKYIEIERMAKARRIEIRRHELERSRLPLCLADEPPICDDK